MKIRTFLDLLSTKFQYELKLDTKHKHPFVIEPIIGPAYQGLYQEYITNCFNENKNKKCHKEINGLRFCKICQKNVNKKNKMSKK